MENKRRNKENKKGEEMKEKTEMGRQEWRNGYLIGKRRNEMKRRMKKVKQSK